MRADTWCTTPAVIVQPLTGIAMAQLAGWPLGTPWLLASLALYAFAGACWLPVLALQLRMARPLEVCVREGSVLPAQCARDQRAWEWLG